MLVQHYFFLVASPNIQNIFSFSTFIRCTAKSTQKTDSKSKTVKKKMLKKNHKRKQLPAEWPTLVKAKCSKKEGNLVRYLSFFLYFWLQLTVFVASTN